MGDYIYMQGRAQIRPTYIKPLQAFFNSRHDDADYELNWPALKDDMPDVIVYSAYKLLVLRHGHGSERIPFGMANPTGWPSHFDDLPDDGSGYGGGELELTDEGVLTFKCSNRNHALVMDAFINLVIAWSSDYHVCLDLSEWSYDLTSRDINTTIYTPEAKAPVDALIDRVSEQYLKLAHEADLADLQREGQRAIEQFSQEEMELMAKDLGIDLELLNQTGAKAKTVLTYTQLMQQPKFQWNPAFLDALRNKLTAALELNNRFLEASNPDSKMFPRSKVYEPDARTQSLDSSLGKYESMVDHINALKLFARGKKGVRQVNRKQRRKMRA